MVIFRPPADVAGRVALVRLGVSVLRDGPTPALCNVAHWTAIVVVVVVGFYFLGEAG